MSIFISIILISEKFVKEVWRTFLFNNDDTHPFLLLKHPRLLYIFIGYVVVMIIWMLNLQLPMQSMPMTTKVVSLNPGHEWCT
jgi:hypothetical protein